MSSLTNAAAILETGSEIVEAVKALGDLALNPTGSLDQASAIITTANLLLTKLEKSDSEFTKFLARALGLNGQTLSIFVSGIQLHTAIKENADALASDDPGQRIKAIRAIGEKTTGLIASIGGALAAQPRPAFKPLGLALWLGSTGAQVAINGNAESAINIISASARAALSELIGGPLIGVRHYATGFGEEIVIKFTDSLGVTQGLFHKQGNLSPDDFDFESFITLQGFTEEKTLKVSQNNYDAALKSALDQVKGTSLTKGNGLDFAESILRAASISTENQHYGLIDYLPTSSKSYQFAELSNWLSQEDGSWVELYQSGIEYGDLITSRKVNALIDLIKVLGESDNSDYLISRDYASPIVFDLDGDGIETIGINNSAVSFDITGDGATERTAWLSPDDAFLTMDLDGNNSIDGVGEMFGGASEGEGFKKLAAYDSNLDGQINSMDVDFHSLRLWRDLNSDGKTDLGELTSLTENSITTISLAYTSYIEWSNGNFVREHSQAQSNAGSINIGDVYFRNTSKVPLTPPHGIIFSAMAANPTTTRPATTRIDLIQRDLFQIGSSENERITRTLNDFATWVYADAGDDTIIDNSRDNIIYGGPGNDTVSSGAGNDYINGGLGADVYIYALHDGSDEIDDFFESQSITNVVVFGAHIGASDISPHRSDADLVISIESPMDTLTIDKFFDINATTQAPVGLFRFSDGTQWSAVDMFRFAESGVTTSTSADEFTSGVRMHGGGFNDALKASAFGDFVFSGAGNDSLDGGAGNDWLYGEDGDDALDGGTGADSMVGGSGNDSYYVDNVNDLVIEATPDENDGILASVNYVLPDFVEDMTLAAGAASAIKATGNTLNNALNGNEFNNVLSGDAGNDNLFGDAGADTLIGGLGDDYYYVGDASDVVQEDVGGGHDTVNLFFLEADGYTLPDNVEAAEVTYMTPTTAAFATLRGNALDNSLTAAGEAGMAMYGEAGDDGLYGGSGNDTLYGGTGADVLWGGPGQGSMLGGAGDDQYYVSETGDRITELADEGTDTVTLFGLKAISYTMAAQVENLDIFEVAPSSGNSFTVFGNAQDNVIDGSGSALRVQLSGGAGNDRLFGTNLNDLLAGGGGNDTMHGGLGNDIYSFARSNGQDVIDDADTSIGNLDQLTFGTGVANDQLWFSQSGQDLVISVIGSTDQVTIRQWSAGSSRHVERITAGGKSLADTQVANLVQAMSAMSPPPIGQTTLSDAQRAQLTPVLAANWA